MINKKRRNYCPINKIQIFFKFKYQLCFKLKHKIMKLFRSISIVLLLAGTTACSQNTPGAVTDAFKTKFSNAQNVKWDKENDSEWEAEFEMDGKEYSANFESDGTWKETEHEIQKSEIPENVQRTLDTEFSGYDIEESEISEKAEGSVYEFELEKGESNLEVAIDSNGKVTKKEEKKEKGEEDDDDED